MASDKPKENQCALTFPCKQTPRRKCAYRSKGYTCGYKSDGECFSIVAQTNAMLAHMRNNGLSDVDIVKALGLDK